MEKNNMIGGKRMNNHKRSLLLFCFLTISLIGGAQDPLPRCLPKYFPTKAARPIQELQRLLDTIPAVWHLPSTFKGIDRNAISDDAGVLSPTLAQLHLLKSGLSEDTIRILHIGDSHVRGHIYPRTTGQRLVETFGAVLYTDMGVNGATCLTFTHADRIAAIAAYHPDLLILSFGTNESHNRTYQTTMHDQQMGELVALIRKVLPDVPMLLTTPPGSYLSFRKGRRRTTYAVNPKTEQTVQTMLTFANHQQIAVWDLYRVVGGSQWACKNWLTAGWMRPDHVHYMPEGYAFQGNLLYEAIVKAYNDYVSN